MQPQDESPQNPRVISDFDPGSVEHGELRARVTGLEHRMANAEARQSEGQEIIAGIKFAQRILIFLGSMVTLFIGIMSIIRHWI